MKKSRENLLKPYNGAEIEKNIYTQWEESGYFNPDNLPFFEGKERTETYTIIMPPPNANGSLHAGHALFVTVQDILIRYHRMRGKKTLWLPGADHAGFETQSVYEKILEKEGRSRFDMNREDLYKEIMAFTLHNKSFMEGQIRDLGASCDWSREAFTLDDKIIRTVYDTFKKLEDDKLLYRGKRIVNWCTKHQTSLSNLETEHIAKNNPFYYFKYGPFTIGTVRPETKFGDKYVVMHPDDLRYKEYEHGQKITVEWINGPIEATIIKDVASDPEFGSGVMTITPWHSGVDFDIAKKYNLDMEQIIDERGKLLPIAGEFAGQSIKDARLQIVEKLKEKGLLEKIDETYTHEVSVCYKCERELEPQVKAQWFVKMDTLAKKALEALHDGKINILSEQHEKVFTHWLNNIQDWNISRQIAWGISIPAKLCISCEAGYVDIENTKTTCVSCGGVLLSDTDTFDTWFSSSQLPYATLNYPDNDFKNYYPTQVMETGADILFFWVARMIMLGIYRTGDVPFKDIYLHGMVRDAKGKKMSKSKGNVISPLEISEKYGTDALRMGLIVNNAQGVDMNLDPKKVEAYKKFANKIWNATRFILEKTDDYKEDDALVLNQEDRAFYTTWKTTQKAIIDDIEQYRLHVASEKLYDYFWKTLCDVIIETHKVRIMENKDKASAQKLLLMLLRETIMTLHPFMPFITEEIWSYIKKDGDTMLMVSELVTGEKCLLLVISYWL